MCGLWSPQKTSRTPLLSPITAAGSKKTCKSADLAACLNNKYPCRFEQDHKIKKNSA